MGRKPNTITKFVDLPLEAEDREVDQDTMDIAVASVSGDVRDFILDRLKFEQGKLPWNKRPEHEQRDTIATVERMVNEMLTRVVEIISADGRKVIAGTLASIQIKDGIKATIELSMFDPMRHVLSDNVKKRVLVVVTDVSDYEGERAPAEVTPDQGDLVKNSMVTHSEPDGTSSPFN